MVSLDDYRKKVPTIEIQLLPDGKIGYSTVGIDDSYAFQALLGCYAVAGDFMETLREKMRCGTGENCGTPE